MAKTAPPKKKGGTSIHSRAAKRASSPSIDTDKSLKNVKLPTESKSRPSILAVHQGAGVSKKSKNGRKSVLSAKARRRQEKGLDKAEAVMDKKEKKVEKSKGRARNVQERSKAWEDLNRKILAKERADALRVDTIEKENWVDEEDEEGKMEEVEVESSAPVDAVAVESIAQSIPLPDEDEIL